MPRWFNCGTLLALAGLAVFALLGFAATQMVCYGPGGADPAARRYQP